MTDTGDSTGYTPVAAPADDGGGSNAVQRGVGRIWNAGSRAAHSTADWVDHNSSALVDVAGDTAETLLGGAATVAGAALVVSGVTACAASTPLVLTGVGAVLTAGACTGGLAVAAAGAALATAGAAAMVDGGSKLGHDLNRLERTGDSRGGGDWPSEVRNKVPTGWGEGAPTRKGIGTRWQDPVNAGNGIRIDRGNPKNSQVTQQGDHVLIRYNGRVIGRNGKPLTGTIADEADQAHIPLQEWLRWTTWFSP